MPRLENWSIVEDYNNPYLAPELRKKSLQGNVYEHKNFVDGTFVTTSSVNSIDLKNKVAQTRNTSYQLGEISVDYQKYLDGVQNITGAEEKFDNE